MALCTAITSHSYIVQTDRDKSRCCCYEDRSLWAQHVLPELWCWSVQRMCVCVGLCVCLCVWERERPRMCICLWMHVFFLSACLLVFALLCVYYVCECVIMCTCTCIFATTCKYFGRLACLHSCVLVLIICVWMYMHYKCVSMCVCVVRVHVPHWSTRLNPRLRMDDPLLGCLVSQERTPQAGENMMLWPWGAEGLEVWILLHCFTPYPERRF